MDIIGNKQICGLRVKNNRRACIMHDKTPDMSVFLSNIGCVMYEMITARPLFPGSNELDQISKIHDVLGTPLPSTLKKFQQYASIYSFSLLARN
jgi:serine/threonine protein kinase